jgi:gliding motility-associated-like protein
MLWRSLRGLGTWAIAGMCAMLAGRAAATHNRAGEITYRHVAGLTYEVVITTYTKTSAIADRPWLEIFWGDEQAGQADSLGRENIVFLPNDVQINTYRGTHTYGGPGAFALRVIDPNRNDGVLNIPGSVDVPFAIRSLLVISPQAGHNSSVQLLNPAIQNACSRRLWIHNPGAHDPDGDVLSYHLVACRGFEGEDIEGFSSPDLISPEADTFTIDPASGDVTWDEPVLAGEYNIAIAIREWRLVEGELVQVGEVVRDMQITVQVCANEPPELEPVADTCVVAGTLLQLQFSADDPDGNVVLLTAVGGPLTEVEHPGAFSPLGNGSGAFAWAPQCAEVRAEPYQLVVKAEDNSSQVDLMDIESVAIRVIAPPPIPVSALPVGNTVELTWLPHTCADELPAWKVAAGGYDIYRKVGTDTWVPGDCETGIPEGLGYVLIGSTEGLGSTTFTDDNLLSFGATYCYRWVAQWPGSGPSIASDPVCATLIKDVPVLTGASVAETSPDAGVVEVAWSPPTEADTLVAFPGPYFYRLYGTAPGAGTATLLATTAPGPYLTSPDTAFTHSGISTSTGPWTYRVEAVASTGTIGSSLPAATPHLLLEPEDNRLELNVQADVPWSNSAFTFFRSDGAGGWVELGTAAEPVWVDSGLVNGQEYCYYARTTGGYDAPGTIDPIVNLSQEACGRPFDYTPPCPPVLALDPDCVAEVNFLAWEDVPGCADDVQGWEVWWAPVLGAPLERYAEVAGLSEFTFNADGVEGTIAGCFAVAALDSLMPGPDGELRRNRSALSDTICVDNCPYYFLPNVFTPNFDGKNDVFEAFPWKFIDSVDVRIYNRYGEEVFATSDPDVLWTGEHREGGMCADGVYYYAARVFTIRLVGRVEETFSGSLHIIDGLPARTE